MITTQAIITCGGIAYSTIGKIGKVFLDDETGKPERGTTKTGMFGGAPGTAGTVDRSEM